MQKQKFYFRNQVHVSMEKIISHFLVKIMTLSSKWHFLQKLFVFVYLSFIESFIAELKKAFQQLDFWLNFVIFDPQKLPDNLDNYVNEELDVLASNYAENQSSTYKGQVSE